MFNWILKQILGSKNQRELKRLMPIVRRINELDEQFKITLRRRIARQDPRLERATGSRRRTSRNARRSLNEILPEAFAVVKNAARRLCGKTWTVCDQDVTWNMIHFDVQLIGGMVLHSGRIAEMATGEGKTLVATLPLYLNALTGRGSHLVTVNDYLARRDAEWMGELFRFLGLTCGCIQHDQSPDVRRAQYACDITYGINSELGFDYLRDNGMATSREQQVQRGYIYAIVDEVDSILIDEARTPLIIAGPGHRFHAPVRQIQARHRATRPQAEHALQPVGQRGQVAAGRRQERRGRRDRSSRSSWASRATSRCCVCSKTR